TEDDLHRLADCDWVIEVIVEKLEPKQELVARLEGVCKPSAVISSNTSGLSINAIAHGRSDDFKRRFLGTHFFNPPRHLKLLEIIPGDQTDPEIVAFIADYARKFLGKGVVICKDTPNFIANRFMSMAGSFAMAYAIDNGYTVEEVDALNGPVIGHPKSGTFRLNDIVGNDVAYHVADNLYPAIPDDESRDILTHPGIAKVFGFLMQNNWLGDKTGQGFYKKVEKGSDREFWPLDLKTLDYVPPQKVRFDSVGVARKAPTAGLRIKELISQDDRGAQYVWHTQAFLLAYASRRMGEIADDILSIDNANRWGFAYELGPFETWDAIGVRDTLPRMEADGYKVASWVHDMLAAGCETFYCRDENGEVTRVYDPLLKRYIDVVAAGGPARKKINLLGLHAASKAIEQNGSASLFDIGDGVCLLEFHSKMNSIDEDILDLTEKALDHLDRRFDALVVGSQGESFSAGANLFIVALAAQSAQFDQLEKGMKRGQDVLMACRYFHKPIVMAPYGYALGGGAEVLMAGSRAVAHMELYAGQVEFGVGLVPGFGGCKELLRRVVNPVMAVPNADALPPLQKVFEEIALAKVSTSAIHACEMGFLTAKDRIVMNRDFLVEEAKQTALEMAAEGYVPPARAKIYAAGRDARSALLVAIYQMREGRYATDHDAVIAKRVAHILCGGDLTAPAWVDEQYILDLEREAFIGLAAEAKTIARISHFLTTGKPLRN
ncbi:MAG TPA: 3-hydroxyacyl-CoA dehydrogenase/enoyl-CoA hydratase family protein, partial [Aggregatilineales bacterium]|nr:3-hydroxyacyl-CoA dehydrogenase/enoyl-CoA hydratase family protein [Aggregatilineales bacterium]